jgi:hypothetical protein
MGPDHNCAPNRLHQAGGLLVGTFALWVIGVNLVRWLCWAQLRRVADRHDG